MLLERAAALASKVTDYEKIKASAHEAQQLRSRAAQFTNVADKLEKAQTLLAALKQAGVSVDYTPTDAAGLREKAGTLRSAVATDPKVLADPPFDLRFAFVDRLAGLATAAEKASSLAWSQWVSQKSNLSSDDVLTALSALPQFRNSIATIKQCRTSITGLAAVAPSNVSAAMAQLDNLLAAHNSAWTDLTAEGIPEDVLTFIKACAGEGAPLALLSDEVVDWLKQRSLTNAFRIKIR